MIFFLEIKKITWTRPHPRQAKGSIIARTALNRQSSSVKNRAPFEGGIRRKRKKKKFHRIRVKQETGLEELTTTRVQKGKKKEEKKGNFRGAERGHWHFVTGQVEQPG